MLQTPTISDAKQLYDFLAGTGFSESSLLAKFSSVETPSFQLRNLPRLRRITQEPTPANLLIRWFLMGEPVPKPLAASVMPDWFGPVCLGCGLLLDKNDQWTPACQIVPYENFFVASDLKAGADIQPDHVLTVNPAAQFLLRFMMRKPVENMLDLCTGCGIQALVAAAHCRQITATDLNIKAVNYAVFNARLNGIENIRCVTGDLFEPVAGQRFDQIVCNPPFIMAPSKEFLYRDSGMELDGFCRRLAREAPAYLNEGGYFQMICEWAQVKGQPWQQRVIEWFDGLDCDVWILKDYTQQPAWYAQTRLRETHWKSAQADAEQYGQWVDFYSRKNLEAIHGGLIAMRRRTGKNSVRIDEMTNPPHGVFGDSILRGFAAMDFLEAHGTDERLLEARLRVAPETRMHQESRWEPGGWRSSSTRLQLSQGLPNALNVDPQIAQFLGGFDGQHTVGQLIESLSAGAGIDPVKARQEALRVVRGMTERGFLLPA